MSELVVEKKKLHEQTISPLFTINEFKREENNNTTFDLTNYPRYSIFILSRQSLQFETNIFLFESIEYS
jgi:hypothetical protein